MAPPQLSNFDWVRGKVDELEKCINKVVLPSMNDIQRNQQDLSKKQDEIAKNIDCVVRSIKRYQPHLDEEMKASADWHKKYKPHLDQEIQSKNDWRERMRPVQTAIMVTVAITMLGMVVGMLAVGALFYAKGWLGIP